MNCTFHSSLNYVSDILDEIALEGLDGITIETLWMRLSVRPKFMFTIDETSQNFLWNIIVKLDDLKFYELPVARQSLSHYDYSITEENMCNDIRVELDEVYPYSSVKNVPGIFGSCQYYSTRINITDEVIQSGLKDVLSKWGNKLVIVASQDCRNAALFGNYCTPNIDFSSSSVNYEILERIGRCRQLGSLTCGKGSLQSLVVDVKSIFHYLKCLMSHGLVRKQSLLGSLSSNSHASLVYLTRFFEESANENFSILKMSVEELKARPPHYMMPCDELYMLFDESKKKRIKKYKTSVVFRRYITVTPSVPYRTVYPNAPQAEWEKKSKGERSVRCFKLINPNVELSDIVEKECESDDEDGNSGFLPRGIYYKNMPIVFQAYHHIKNAGPKGLSHGELGQIMGLNKYFIRGLIKRLTSDKLCKFYFETDGKWRSKRYIVGEHAQTKAAASEIAQILSETNTKSESTEENNCGSTSTVKVEIKSLPKLQEENMSYRGLKRVGLIIKSIKAHRFRLFHQIKKFVHEEEKKEGLTITVDRQTIQKLLKKLEADGLIKKFVLTGKGENSGNNIKIYSDPAFDPDERMKENIYATCTAYASDCKEEWAVSLENEFSNALLENLAEMQKILQGVVRTVEKPVGKETELTYLYSPKFIRLNLIHDFMFHLVYGYSGLKDKSQEELMEELSKTSALEDDLRAEMPRLYATEPSNYMFVPPLNNSGKIPGCFLISDLLTRMPLSMMVKVIRISESCPDLWKYLNHPVRKHFLVRDLPLSVRRVFFCRKNQITNFYFDMRRLSFIGLVQFGPRFGKEHYQTILYLNRKASLLDTIPSPPCYVKLPSDVEFSVKRYEFLTKSDVKKYWMDMFDICMGTNLGEKEHLVGDEVLAERELSKESLKKYYEPKSVEQAMEQDNGDIPGDHLGAAGLDSGMFSFLRNNWNGPVKKTSVKNLNQDRVKKLTKVPLQKLRKEHRKFDKDRKKFGTMKTRRKLVTINLDKILSIPKAKPRKKQKKVQGREKEAKRLRKPSYDETDLEALKLMNTLRVTWSTAEDNLLLLCRVAMMFLCPNPKAFAKIPRAEVRRALQQYVPESRNKTQSAIARRVVYMMKNPTTARSVNLCLEELKEMSESKRFDCSELVERIKPSAADLGERQRELYEKFHELLAFLKDRFIDNPNPSPRKGDNDLIPDSLEEFLEKFQTDMPTKEVIDIKFIRENVIRGILMSSFCCLSDKTSSAVQLFDIYRQYNEDELQNAIRNLHSDKVVTIKKKNGSAMFKSGNILPLTFSPFKLSYAFQHMLNTKYAHSIYAESFSQITKLLQISDDTELHVDLNECNVALFLLASREILSFKAILPEQIIALDKGDLSDSTYSKMVVKYCRMLEYSQSNSKVVCTSGKVISKADVSSLSASTSNKRPASDSPPESEVPEKRQKSESDSGTGACKLEVEEPTMPEQEEHSELKNEKKTRSSRVILYMMREEAKKDAKHELGGRMIQDFCVVNSSQVFIRCQKGELERFAEKLDSKANNVIVKNIVSRSLYPINLVDESLVIENMKEENDIAMAKSVLDLICSKKELGATVEDLKANFSDTETLSRILKILVEAKVLLRSGVNETRYVSQKYSTPWLLSSFKMKRIEREKLKPNEASAVALSGSTTEDENPKKKAKGIVDLKNEEYNPPACSSNINNKIKLIIRPWIRIDGSLNRKVLDRFLGTILGFVLSHPGCSLRNIMDKFVPSIMPIWTKDLVEILVEIGCLKLKTFTVVQKATLFSKSVVEISVKHLGLIKLFEMDEEELDYMSDEFIKSCTDSASDVRPGLLKTHNEQRQHNIMKKRNLELENKKKPTAVLQVEVLEEALKQPITATNKGFSMLEKMGFKSGMGLGKNNSGIKEPIGLNIKNDKVGLGHKIISKTKPRKTVENKLDKISEDDFRAFLSKKSRERETLSDFRKSQRVCKELDLKSNKDEPEESWFWPEDDIGAKESESVSDDEVDDDKEIELSNSEKLEMITKHLREVYFYCIWCKVQYNDEDDMRDCPGPTRDDH